MSYKIELVEPKRTIEIESDLLIDSGDPQLASALIKLSAFNVIVPLVSLKVERKSLTPVRHEEKFVTVDGREWEQNIYTIGGGIEAMFKFDVDDHFKRSEITGHLLILDAVVGLIATFQIVKIECRYL